MDRKTKGEVLTMLYGAYNAFRIIDILSSERGADEIRVNARPWAALAFREKGSSLFTVEGRAYYAGEGSLLYVPKGVAFSRRSTEERLIILHLDVYAEGEDEVEVTVCQDPIAARELFYALLSLWEEKAEGYEHYAAGMLHHFFAGLAGAERRLLLRRAEALIARGVEYLSAHYSDPEISVSDVAAYCSVSEEYFRRLYKKAFGISPHRAIIEKRIHQAAKLLRTTDLSIEQIAYRCGFSDCKYFSTLYRKEMKLSPSTYRRAMQADV